LFSNQIVLVLLGTLFIGFVLVFNIAFWVQRFSFSLQCYGLWLTHVFGFVSYSDPFRIEIRRGERKEWNGMEWCGMKWNEMEWSGMEWNGMAIGIREHYNV
jgi:hypothetical protein